MKKYLLYIVIFLIGAVAGMWLCRSYHFRDEEKMVQRDTIVRFDTIRYSSLELTTNRSKLNIPAVSVPKFVNIPSDSVTIIYRDNVRYVTLPRQYFHTQTKDAEIWHSGIDSRIDSLNVFHKTTEQTLYYNCTTRKNSLALGIEARYITDFSLPLRLEYERKIRPWFSVSGSVLYDVRLRQWGAGIGTKVMIDW